MNTLAVHLFHDSTLSVNADGIISNIELERVYGKRHYDWHRQEGNLDDLASLLAQDYQFDKGLSVGAGDKSAEALFHRLGIATVSRVDHHAAHAAAAFYQSPYERSLLISYDGGGNDGTFCSFIGCRDSGVHALGANWELNLGIPYRALAHPIAEIRKPDDGRERSNAGKLMGLAAYGQVRPEWVAPITDYYYQSSSGGDMHGQRYRWVLSLLPPLGSLLGINLCKNALTGADAFDLACTAQHVFELLFLERVLPLIEKHRLPVCISGGCALNVLTNQRLASLVDVSVFVPPNPNDCGLALGALLLDSRPKLPANVTYSGVPILDRSILADAVSRFGAVHTVPREIAQVLSEGCVLAVMRGNSEHGPRALGNRSLLCDPAVPDMKHRLNTRVKFRETFRPYAPVIRACDVSMYFENGKHDMSFMSFNPTVKVQWRGALASACHVDFTARAQTVTAVQNPWLYDVLTEFEKQTGRGALLNTSFNSKGLPMITRISDALDMYFSTDIDCLLIEDWLFRKKSGSV